MSREISTMYNDESLIGKVPEKLRKNPENWKFDLELWNLIIFAIWRHQVAFSKIETSNSASLGSIYPRTGRKVEVFLILNFPEFLISQGPFLKKCNKERQHKTEKICDR